MAFRHGVLGTGFWAPDAYVAIFAAGTVIFAAGPNFALAGGVS